MRGWSGYVGGRSPFEPKNQPHSKKRTCRSSGDSQAAPHGSHSTGARVEGCDPILEVCGVVQRVKENGSLVNIRVDLGELTRVAELVSTHQLDKYDESTNSIFRNGNSAAGHPCSWLHGSFHLGLVECAISIQDDRYWEHIVKFGERNEWRLGPRFAHADDYVIGQTYLEVFEHLRIEAAADQVRRRLSEILEAPPKVGLETDLELDPPIELEGYVFNDSGPCKTRWSWCDALHMAPALWVHLSKLDDDTRFLDYADSEYWESCSYLCDQRWSLFHRDSRFFPAPYQREDISFWGRGNGWVVLGLRRIIDKLPVAHPSRHRYIELFQAMANRIVLMQGESGFWGSELSPSRRSTDFETSGTAMFVASFAWGLRKGLLDKATFESALELGWRAVQTAVRSDGRVGWVQGVDDRPREASFDGAHIYGSGAVLHACAELVNLAKSCNEVSCN